MTRLKGRDFISILDITRADMESLFEIADSMQAYVKTGIDRLSDRILGTLFFEPSTRTRLSFETAMIRLGGGVIGFSDPSTARVVTGESLADTIRMADSYANVIVLRHKIEGSARLAAEVADVPVINAGDGSQHHPTQTLTDLYTIWRRFGTVDGLKIALLGDLMHTRSASSLCFGLTLFKNVEIYLASPPELRARPEITDFLNEKGVHFSELVDVEDIIHDLDVLYVTRLQKERFTDPTDYEKVKGSYFINRKVLRMASRKLIVMHHLPRIDEIPLEVDLAPQAHYFQQAANGLPARMALLSEIVE